MNLVQALEHDMNQKHPGEGYWIEIVLVTGRQVVGPLVECAQQWVVMNPHNGVSGVASNSTPEYFDPAYIISAKVVD